MVDPIALAIVSAAAGKGAEALVADARTALGVLFRMVRQRFAGCKESTTPLDAFLATPADPDCRDTLIAALNREIIKDPGFAEALRDQWRLAQVEVEGSRPDVHNQFSGTAGTVIQARDISGGVTF